MQNTASDVFFSRFITPHEHELKQKPQLFMAKFWLMLLAGYLVIFSVHFIGNCLGGLVGAAISAYLFDIPVSQITPLIGKSMPFLILYTLVELNPFRNMIKPKGLEIIAHDYPLLFAELVRLQGMQKAPRIYKIWLNHECNAGVQLTPRFLFLGGYTKHSLSIGINLLLITSPEQMRAVLAHEWEHLGNKWNKMEARSYVIIRFINVLVKAFNKYKWVKLANLFTEYLSVLSVFAQICSRHGELQADATAVRLTEATHVSQGLLNFYVYRDWLEAYYWNPLCSLTRLLPEPTVKPYQDLQAFLHSYRFKLDELAPNLKQLLSQQTAPFDSHPSLSERLSAINALPELSALPALSAAELWFAGHLDGIIEAMDKDWQKTYAAAWRDLYKKQQAEGVKA